MSEEKKEENKKNETAKDISDTLATEEKKESPSESKTPKEDKKEKAPQAETETETEAEVEVEIPKEFKDIVEKIEKMSVMELHSLVKLLEKKFGVSAQAAVFSGPAQATDEGAEEKSLFTVELKSAGDSKIGVIKAVKAALGLGLKEAKDLVDQVPSVLKEGMKREEAETLKKEIEEAGGKIELK
ncbi:50S ribosomal protein L7/L12 [Candidatus Campbellbacteria bacterium CG11_big_fil_rev_8_21_14_0_20_44_21]|uniref:Large ribosomal subunit protein bL12 n=1 Tax=Candidatus Campbellbacteria bacterium CG22_combo_CG10-13_8_21_14_all_43_18 TaxID=1974530 RepID=A0A2H0DWF7_9BACT|nr:MAG: 50S ribosomal protein L7/L12 [Candidatus Campbellbacteria bacterium CG22_combo_CG10-13_8_21_14_all_43_18]PIR24326.1 MAG: 50S ribosomal protein L7/L12 [Candidatus Campbellbacteria bacterium CG11_big_fil_rev_8_21_14_0_20_44_21]